MRDLLRSADLSAADLHAVLDLAAELKVKPYAEADLLRGETVGVYFNKPSTRTRLSVAAAIVRLGGVPQVLGPGDLQLGRGETIEDTAAVVSRYLRAFVIRTFDHRDVERFAAASSIPVINALTGLHHPCQSLADLLTLREQFGALAGLKVAYLGAGTNVAHSLMEAGALAGMSVRVATPPGYEPDAEVLDHAQRIAAIHAGSVEVLHDPAEAATGADAIYTDVWLSMGDPEQERALRMRDLEAYRVTPAVMARAGAQAVFLHCLPAHRGEEVAAEVMDGPQSVVFDQAENRLCTVQAVLVLLLKRRPAGVT